MKIKNFALVATLLCGLVLGNQLAPGIALAATDNPFAFTYQGRVLTADGSGPLLDTVDLRLDIFDPSGTCLLYEETQSGIDLSTSSGLFSVLVGSAMANRTVNVDPGLAIPHVFANKGSLLVPPGPFCTYGYSPAAGDNRILRVTVTPLSTRVPTTLTPDMTINSVPFASVAETLQGLGPSDLIQATGTVSQAAMQSLTGGRDIGNAFHNHDSLYVKLGASSANGSFSLGPTSTLGLGNFTNVQQTTLISGLSTLNAGMTWYNSTTNEVYIWTGSQVQQLAVAGSGVGPVTYDAITGNIGITGLSNLGSANQLMGMNAGGTALEYKTLIGTANQITVNQTPGAVTFSIPQNIGISSSPTFSGITLNGLSGGIVRSNGSGILSSSLLNSSDIPAPLGDVTGTYGAPEWQLCKGLQSRLPPQRLIKF